jgi:hypothetical protein
LYFPGEPTLCFPVLEGSQAIPVHRSIRIDGAGIQVLSDDQAGLPVGIHSFAHPRDICLNGDISAELFPDIMELIAVKPHVGAASRKGVGTV